MLYNFLHTKRLLVWVRFKDVVITNASKPSLFSSIICKAMSRCHK
uniref:Uncharacterized protein n=1 Tax=Lepeophtheirus salmonis TaxID=72036 RepID=A0A0K2V2W6_LEPSM